MPIEKPTPALDIDALKKKHKTLEIQKAKSEESLRNATETLEALKEEARAKYATDDLEQLRRKLQEMKDQNERKRAEYQDHLAEIETRLAQVEKNFTDPKPQ